MGAILTGGASACTRAGPGPEPAIQGRSQLICVEVTTGVPGLLLWGSVYFRRGSPRARPLPGEVLQADGGDTGEHMEAPNHTSWEGTIFPLIQV